MTAGAIDCHIHLICPQKLADLSDPLLDVLAQRHSERDRPLFVS